MELPALYNTDCVSTDYICPICFQTLNHPILLIGCGHNICANCLKSQSQTIMIQNQIKCPNCKQNTEVPNGDISSLPYNEALTLIMDKLDIQRKQEYILKKEMELCMEHKQPFVLLCMDHNELCCIICAQFGDHQGHRVKDLKNAKEDVQKEIQQLYEQAKKKKQMAEQVLLKYDELTNQSDAMLNEQLQYIDQTYDIFLNKIQEVRELRLQEIQRKFDEFQVYIDEQKSKFTPLMMNFENLTNSNNDILTQVKYREDLERIKNIKVQSTDNLQIVVAVSSNTQKLLQDIESLGKIKNLRISQGTPNMLFDPNKKSKNIKVLKGGLKFQKISGGEFNTVLSVEPLALGKSHSWYLKLLQGNYFKLGVAQQTYNDYEHAFSDFITGWGWYIYSASLRHNSNGSGANYGSRCEVNDVIGIHFDTQEGTLSFSKNFQNLGIAYTEEIFKKEPFFAAFSCLHNNDTCEIVDEQGKLLQENIQLQTGYLFMWDPDNSYSQFIFSEQNRVITFQGCSTYRTALCKPALLPNKIYRWKLRLLTETDYKIGVSKATTTLDQAFCDKATGWAFFNRDVQLRHNSNGNGPAYGKKVNENGIVEVICNTKNGDLAFVLDGQKFENAYSGVAAMCDGNLYPAVAALANNGSIEIFETTVENA